MRFGRLSFASYQRLVGAETYGSASSMGSLQTDLFRLLGRLQERGNVVVDRGARGQIVIGSRSKFYEWLKSDFPDAYDCFFKKSDGGSP